MCGGAFMDALKEARPEVYNDLVQIGRAHV